MYQLGELTFLRSASAGTQIWHGEREGNAKSMEHGGRGCPGHGTSLVAVSMVRFHAGRLGCILDLRLTSRGASQLPLSSCPCISCETCLRFEALVHLLGVQIKEAWKKRKGGGERERGGCSQLFYIPDRLGEGGWHGVPMSGASAADSHVGTSEPYTYVWCRCIKRESHPNILGIRGPMSAWARRAVHILQDGGQRQAGAGSQGSAARSAVHRHGEQGTKEPRHVCSSSG